MAESVEHCPAAEEETTTIKTDLLKHFPVYEDTPPKKILFLGDEGIGKTTFLKKYCEHDGVHHVCYGYRDSVLVFSEFVFDYRKDEGRIAFRLMDIPSGTDEKTRSEHYPDKVDSIVFCFAIDNPSSLSNVWNTWLPESRKYYPEFSRIYLLGLRSDTRQKMLEENKAPVTLERGSEIHEKNKFVGEYMECSVEKNPQQAFDLMKTLITDVLRCKAPTVAV